MWGKVCKGVGGRVRGVQKCGGRCRKLGVLGCEGR